MDHLERAKQVFDIEMEGLQSVKDRLDDSFQKAVDRIVEALRNKGKIVVVGIGKSGNVGVKIAATLTSTGSTSVVLSSVDALHGDLGIVCDGDIILVLSYSGESEELNHLIAALKRMPVFLVAMTGHPESILGRRSDLALNVAVPREACPFNMAPTASTTAMLVLGDALAMAVLEARGFRKEDFARYHPSGAIGRALLLRVCDIMRREERNPVARESISVKEALLVMTRCRSGSVSVVDAQGRLSGIFTDGDLRRHLASEDMLLNGPLSDFMSRSPVCIQETALAVEALKIFNERDIDDLIVVNGRGEPVGLIDLQDLPKLKVM